MTGGGWRATKRLVQKRRRMGWTQQMVARAAGLGQDVVSKIEAGNRIMIRRTAERIATAYGTTVEAMEAAGTLKYVKDRRRGTA